ncbi:hypothetical protein NK8_63500 (plasmid) [Caballeronia sp. NK8]|uniref:hypothetical protein n=1 Tax=Caballeronia sp. NK8 TaxID=140098 RepID=UPI001BB601B5|nr:hypothetical protein [Caballeronia sp. NK8]BCQ28161.1 hypothetical protein NK8_63500 [Caballeronia sp. NK8]
MRGYSIDESLVIIWQLSRHVVAGGPAPSIEGAPGKDLRKIIFPHQLSLVCREVLLHGTIGRGTRTLSNWQDLEKAFGAVQAYLEYTPATTEGNFQLELHRIGQQQLSLQRRPSLGRFMRYVALYENKDVAAVLERAIGISARDYTFLGFMTYTHFAKSPRFVTSVDLEKAGIDHETRDRFFERMTGSLSATRAELRKSQRFDHTWAYTFDTLDDRPLVNLDPLYPERTYCPMPERMLTRFTEGTFYLLFQQKGFDAAFGKAFEEYTADVLRRTCMPSRVTVHEEMPFMVRGNVHHGVDFVLSDIHANVFVECKTKRLNLRGRVASSAEDLDAQLTILAEAIAQNYRNIALALDGKSHWVRNSLPCANLVVTLEDWLLVSPDAHDTLVSKVQAILTSRGCNAALLQQIPFAILCAEKFEVFCCAIAKHGIKAVVDPLFEEYRGPWTLSAHLETDFRDVAESASSLFADAFAEYGQNMVTPVVN